MRIHSNKPLVGPVTNWAAQNNPCSSGMDTQNKVIEAKKSGSTNLVDYLGNSGERTDIMESASQLLEVREARVQAIKESVTAGTYIICPTKIAEKMLKWI